MLLASNAFPYRDISHGEARTIKRLWKGPVSSKQALGFFMETGGKPLLHANPVLTRFMGLAKNRMLGHMELNGVEYDRAYTGGALFYASVFAYINTASELPVADTAIDKFGDMEEVDLAVESVQRIQETAQTFCELMEDSLAVISRPPKVGQLAVLGAGTLHVLVLESSPSIMLNEQHPELADLNELFSQLPSE